MFTESAEIYDLIYSFKDYAKESSDIITMIRSAKPNCRTILDIGCGTSEHHNYLKEHFSIDGIDLNPDFIRISKEKNPENNYRIENMKQFELNKRYDVIICLFSSIGYLRSLEEITSALNCFNSHLEPGGLIIVEPWFNKENWSPGKVNMITGEKNELKVCRMSSSDLSGDFSVVNFHYLIGSEKTGVHQLNEKHELRLTSREEMIGCFERANFDVTYDEKGLTGRGLYYGIKNH